MSMEQVNDRLVNFASDIDENTMEQAKLTSQLPFIFPHVALMPVSQVLACTPQHPLFGNKQPKQTGTHWIVFMKEALDEIPQD